jgi:hypothetical protein
LNPNDPRIRNYKTREQAFMVPLKEKYSTMVLDTIICGGCSRRRPDGLLDCGTHSIIVEIDEDQHSGYDQLCDNRRTMEIFRDLGSRPIVFIRLNPDSYKKNNKRIGGTFSTSRNGELKCNNAEFKRRMKALYDVVDVNIKTIPEPAVSCIQLFFDNGRDRTE